MMGVEQPDILARPDLQLWAVDVVASYKSFESILQA
jgi:hypothetical protein